MKGNSRRGAECEVEGVKKNKGGKERREGKNEKGDERNQEREKEEM